MKGQELQEVTVSVFLVLLLLSFAFVISAAFFGDKGLYEKFAKPVDWAGSAIAGGATKEYRDFLARVQAIFTGGTLNVMCTEWYYACGCSDSPWNNKPNLAESEVSEASKCLCFDKGADSMKKIDEQWSKADPEFANYIVEQKREIMKNACLAELRAMMTKEDVE